MAPAPRRPSELLLAARVVAFAVSGVLLLGPTTDPRLRRPGVLAARWLRTAVREPWWQVPLVVVQWLRTGPRAMTALWRRLAGDRVDERLRRVAVPVLVVVKRRRPPDRVVRGTSSMVTPAGFEPALPP